MQQEDVEDILEVIEQIDGIMLLDMSGMEGTWKRHINRMYHRINIVRAICEGNQEDLKLYRGLAKND